MTRNRISIAALTIAFFVLPLFAATPVAANDFTINVEQQHSVDQIVQGLVGEPGGNWEPVREQTTVYLRSNMGGDAAFREATGNGGNVFPANYAEDSQGTGVGEFWFDTQVPTGNAHGTNRDGMESVSVGPSAGNQASFNPLGWDQRTGSKEFGDWYNLTIYSFEASIWGDVSRSGDRLVVEAWLAEFETGNRVEKIGEATLVPDRSQFRSSTTCVFGVCETTRDPAQLYQGNVIIDNLDGVNIPYGQFLSFDIYGTCNTAVQNVAGFGDCDAGDGEVRFHLNSGSWDSRITITTNAPRLNYWSENTFGDVTNNFPTGALDQTEDTRIRFKFLMAHMLGNNDGEVDGCTDTGAPQPSANNTRDFRCPRDAIDQRQMQLRLRNMDTGQLMKVDVGRGLDPADPNVDEFTARCCNNDFRLINYTRVPVLDANTSLADGGKSGMALFEYEFAYNNSFPDGTYRIEIRNEGPRGLDWEKMHVIHIGGEAFDLYPDTEEDLFQTYVTDEDGEIILPRTLIEVNHTIGVGERTDYHLILENTGKATDTYGLSVPVPGGGWQATVHPTTVSLPPGGKAEVSVIVTPPASAVTGDWRAVDLVAGSLLIDSETSLRLNTTLTSVVSTGVRLQTEQVLVEAHPTVAKKFPVNLINMGSHEDTFVITASGLPDGWLVDINPPFVSAYSKSAQDFMVTVTLPPEAQGGDAATLILRATRVADNAVFDELQIPVRVIFEDEFSVDAPHGVDRTWRDWNRINIEFGGTFVGGNVEKGADRTFDKSAMYRLVLNNDGDREDTYEITSSWVPPRISTGGPNNLFGYDRDSGACDGGNPDGVPDGWRFRMVPWFDSDGTGIQFNAQTSTYTRGTTQTGNAFPNNPDNGEVRNAGSNSFSGDMPVGVITIPPHTSVEYFMELGWESPRGDSTTDGCPDEPSDQRRVRFSIPSPTAGLRLTTRSLNDPTEFDVKTLTADVRTGRGDTIQTDETARTAAHDVAIEPRLTEPGVNVIPKDSTGTYQMRAINQGNEHDKLRVIVTTEAQGWTHAIDTTDIRFPPGFNTVSVDMTNSRSCNFFNGDREMVCEGLGVYDEVWFNVTATPPAGARIGDMDSIKVSVSGGFQGGGSVGDSVRMIGRVGGPYLFEETELASVLDVSPENTAAFPFVVDNLGLENDRYEFTITEGPAGWTPRLSSVALVGVPAQNRHLGFLTVTAPAGAVTSEDGGDPVKFVVRVRSTENRLQGTQQIEFLEFNANVIAANEFVLSSDPITALRGETNEFAVRLDDLGQNAGTYHFEIEPQTLPAGWELVCGPQSPPEPAGCNPPPSGTEDPYMDIRTPVVTEDLHIAEAKFYLTIGEDDLSTSRMAIRVKASTPSGDVVQYHDVEINLATKYGVALETVPVSVADGGNVGVVAPGQTFIHKVDVRNTGLSPQLVKLTSSAIAEGWTLTFGRSQVYVLPGSNETVNVIVEAPKQAITGSEFKVRIAAAIAEDTTATATVDLLTTIGRYDLVLDGKDETVFVAPRENAAFPLTVANQGTVRDTVDVKVALPTAYEGRASVTWSSGQCDLVVPETNACRLIAMDPDDERQVVANVVVSGDDLPGGTKVSLTVSARSLLAPVPDSSLCPGGDPSACPNPSVALVTDTVRFEVLAYQGQDVDGDGLREYAIDRDQTPGNGFEEFREHEPGAQTTGLETRVPDLAQFLTPKAREGGATGLNLDADDDGQVDFLLDSNLDDLIDLFWDPDARVSTEITTIIDVTGEDQPGVPDGVPEYFIDIDGDDQLDVWYDLTQGRFGQLIKRLVDDDDFTDYVIDLNDNGQTDDNEPILFGGPGGVLRKLIKVDMDGDGRLDEVYDDDGDGRPDYFKVDGSDRRYAINVRDVDKDPNDKFVDEWAFDADGDGREDTYYDLDDGKSHLIDGRSDFVRSLQDFWYIGAIFGLVLVLFVVLVAVTRR